MQDSKDSHGMFENDFSSGENGRVIVNVSSVVEFQRWWVLKINIFGQELTYSKEFSLIESVHAGLSKSAQNHTFKVNIRC